MFSAHKSQVSTVCVQCFQSFYVLKILILCCRIAVLNISGDNDECKTCVILYFPANIQAKQILVLKWFFYSVLIYVFVSTLGIYGTIYVCTKSPPAALFHILVLLSLFSHIHTHAHSLGCSVSGCVWMISNTNVPIENVNKLNWNTYSWLPKLYFTTSAHRRVQRNRKATF